VERLFGTLQDRLVIELRLAGASTLEQANAVFQAYLPRFNAQFAVEPAQGETAYRPLPEVLNLDTIFCFKYERTVALDNTVTLGEHRLQLLPEKPRRSYARAQVEVHERLDGSLAVCYAGRCLLTTTAPEEAPVLRARHGRRAAAQAVSRIQPSPASGEPLLQAPQGKGEEAAAFTKERPSSVPGPDHPWRKPLLKPNRQRSAPMSAQAPVPQHPPHFSFHQVQEKRGHATRSPVKAGSLSGCLDRASEYGRLCTA
jgi:hypothetical protein